MFLSICNIFFTFWKIALRDPIESSHIMHINSFYSIRPILTSIKYRSIELLFVYDKL